MLKLSDESFLLSLPCFLYLLSYYNRNRFSCLIRSILTYRIFLLFLFFLFFHSNLPSYSLAWFGFLHTCFNSPFDFHEINSRIFLLADLNKMKYVPVSPTCLLTFFSIESSHIFSSPVCLLHQTFKLLSLNCRSFYIPMITYKLPICFLSADRFL
ncbi:hypothetical protein HanXRQr2_Chr04g0175151 [Helianthus annuus]|uniref:Uncharacterized protein n=1 Tax=Helianthus annuus TaxID=4232 RepID=A0A251UZY2_HELAN|nr:hypothetical protein HanXRQr2_Chr04g0175151 [Helianthus annuus]KAJ0511530.1 hypothetical protein HanIR_Chr11g0553131 [Helianthus annuus]KAJ0597613.1 hypothetical protein HanHA89_Chr04g0156611 [Helianthus annuus]KAJ0653287.1 hypothetical protein HanOQP8_Chr15g0581811 [Helianthus annuus]